MISLKLNKRVVYYINLVLLQNFILVVTAYYILSWFSGSKSIRVLSWQLVAAFLVIVALVFAILNVSLIKGILKLAEKEIEAEVNKVRLEENEKLIDALRAQRHDFISHLQVILGLSQLGKLCEITSYIKDIYPSGDKPDILNTISKYEILTIVNDKTEKARDKNIQTSCSIKTNLNYFKIPGPDVASIMSNLIDNAISALEIVDIKDKSLNITIYQNKENYIFEINNSHPVISEELQQKIFEKGYTTKAGTSHGYGLNIVKSKVEENGGHITLTSNEKTGTTFIVELPVNGLDDV